MSKLIIDGNAVYEIDEECMKKSEVRRKDNREVKVLDKKESISKLSEKTDRK